MGFESIRSPQSSPEKPAKVKVPKAEVVEIDEQSTAADREMGAKIEAHKARLAAKKFLQSEERRIEKLPDDYLTYGGILGGVATMGGIAAGFAMDSPTTFWAGTAAVVAGPLAGYLSGKFKQYLEQNKLKKQKEELAK